MREINLEDAAIKFEGEWLSVEDLTHRIQQKMEAGEFKFANLAAALEELNHALEKSQVIETKLVISKANYERLIELGDGDSHTAVRKAVKAFIKSGAKADSAEVQADRKTIKCAQCNLPIEILTDETPEEIVCPECGTSRPLKSQNKKDVRHQDHFLG